MQNYSSKNKIKILKSKFLNLNSLSGQSLVEILIAFALVFILLPALLTGFAASREGRVQQNQRISALPLLNEGAEAVRSVREKGWSAFATNGTYYPQVAADNSWQLVSTPTGQSISGFNRLITISDTRRNASGAIVSSGGTLDPSTKKVTVAVSWTQPSVSSITKILYLTRTNNAIYTETTKAHFDAAPVPTGVMVVTSAPNPIPTVGDGQIQLTKTIGLGGGDWCNPGANVVKTFDLPGNGVANAISAKALSTQDVAYTTTGGNASGDAVDSLVVTQNRPPTVTNPSNNNEAKAYGIYVDSTNSYVYFNENKPPNHTVRIANGTTLANIGYYDASGSGDGSSVFIAGTVGSVGAAGYTTVGSKLYKFNMATINGASSQGELGSVTLSGTGKKVIVVGSNAYVATSSTTSQLQIINTSSMAVTNSVNLGNGVGAVDLYVNSTQTYAYVVTGNAATATVDNFFIVNLNTNAKTGYKTINSMVPKGITVIPQDNVAVIVGTGGQLYQVFNVLLPTGAYWCGGMNPSGVANINAVDSVIQSNGYVFSYILTDNSSAEFQIVEGGTLPSFSTSGTFISQIMPLTSVSNFNRLTATVAVPSLTTLSFQVAGADQVAGSCSGATYNFQNLISPTLTGSTLTGIIPEDDDNTGYENPARCFKYKALFTSTDSNQTPVIYDVSINYSP